MILKALKRRTLLIIATSLLLALILVGCMNVPLPSKPQISFSPVVPVAGQRVTVSITSNDDYSDLYYSAAIDGVPLQGNPQTGTFYWISKEGTHTVVATVTDDYNNSISATTVLKVKLPPPPNVEKVMWYPSNPIGGENVDFEVEATSIIGISDVSLKIDSSSLNVTENGKVYTAKWEAIPGEHTLRVSVKDNMGTVFSTQTAVDVGPYPFPKIRTFTWTPQNPTLNDKRVVFKVVGEDPSGFYANISVDGKDLDTTFLSTSTAVATWDVTVGYHEITVRLENSKGWYVQKIYHLSIKPPQSDLSIQIGITPNSPKHGDNVTVKAYASDSYAPIQAMTLFVDGAEMTQISTNTLSYTFTPSDGSHEITVKAIDKMNEKTSSNLFFTVAFDPQMYPPYLSTRFTPTATVGIPKLLSVFASPTAPSATIRKVTFIDMTDSTSIGESTSTSNGIFSTAWTPSKAGYIPILINAVDSYNTVSSTVVMVNVAPQAVNDNSPLIRPAFDSLIKQSSFVTLAASVSSKNEIKSVEMWVDNVPLTPTKNSSGLYCIKWIASATGTHAFTVSAEDIYAHKTTDTFYFYVYPSKLPVVRLRMNSNKFYTGDEIVATADILKSNSQIDHVNFYVDNVLKDTEYLPPYTFKEKAKNVGMHTLMAEAVDIYANKGYAQANFAIEKDETPPYLSVSAPSTIASGGIVKVKIATFDKESGVKSLKVDVYSSISPQPYPGIVPIISKTFSHPSTYTFISFVATGQATYKIDVLSKDAFDNSSYSQKSVITQ